MNSVSPHIHILCATFNDACSHAASESARHCVKVFAITYKEWNTPDLFHVAVDADTLNDLNNDYNVVAHHRYQFGVSK
jgi:hypothetical protein